MLERVELMNHEHSADAAYPQLKIGIGVHTGSVTAGNIGALDRLEYSVIGETVNLASRLEGLTKELKTSIVLSGETFQCVRDRFFCQALGPARVRGLEREIQVYTALRRSSPS